MLVSLEWLRQYVDFDLTPEGVAEQLTMAGFEVEAIESVGTPMSDIVVGHIRSIDKHPNADRLVVCDVDVGGETKRIVCGAANMKVGDKVPTALVGAEMPGGFRIDKRPLRGVVSEGMMCSAAELEVGEDASGLLILPEDAPVGVPFDEYAHLTDKVLDVSLTANRPDCACMVGLARELGTLLGHDLREPSTEVIESDRPVQELTRVDIMDDDLCPRYAARVVTDVTVGPSPMWMAERLRRAGLRPINNVVDATNYVLLELGHPLHAFDYDKLDEHRIVVRRARDGETITTIDDVRRQLAADMLVIADATEPVALAGIMGGAESEISDDTRRVLIESACFLPTSIRRTSKTLGLMTEASYRFERGADVEIVPKALDRAARLVAELAGGRVAGGMVDEYPRPIQRRNIVFRPGRARRLLGCKVSTREMKESLERLGFQVSDSDRQLDIEVPTRRVDVSMETDLIEEVGRVHGFDRLPSHVMTRPAPIAISSLRFDRRNLVRDILVTVGFSEAITYSFINPELAARAGFGEQTERMIRLQNPLSQEQGAMRMSLIPSLLNVVGANYRRGRPDCRLFEIGRVFMPTEPDSLPHEPERLACVVTGLVSAQSWTGPPLVADIFVLKGAVETLAERMDIDSVRFDPHDRSAFAPGCSFDVRFGDTVVGCLGEVSPAVCSAFEIEQQVYICELDVEDLISHPVRERRYTSVSPYPPVYRDLAVVVSDNVPAGDVAETIRGAAGERLSDLRLFDLYRGRQVPRGKKSLAYSLTFVHTERTLTDDETDTIIDTIVKQLTRHHGAALRSQ